MPRRRQPESPEHDSRPPTRRVALLLLLFLTCLYLFTASPEAPFIGDGGEMLRDAASLATHGLSVRDEAGRPRLSKFPPGQPILNLSVAWCFSLGLAAESATGRILFGLLVSLLPALIGASTGVLLFLCGLRLGLSPRVSLLTALLQGLATMTWPYAQTLFADPTLGCLWLLAFYALLRYRDQAGRGWLVVAGAACGYSVLTKLTAAPVVLVLGGYLAWLLSRRGVGGSRSRIVVDGLAFAVPVLLFLGVLCWYNHLRFGDFMATGYGDAGAGVVRLPEPRDGDFGFNTPLPTGLFGLLLSPGKGIFWYCPVLFLAIPGLVRFWRRARGEAATCLAVIAVVVLTHAKWWAWHGDWAFGPRFLVGAVPFATVGCGWWFDSWSGGAVAASRRRLWKALAVAVVVVSVGVQLLGVAVPYASHLQLILGHTPEMRYGPYDERHWPIRDDTVHGHFIPELSPLAGHAWIASCLLCDGEARRRSPPWIGLNPRWRPDGYNVPQLFHWNVWWAFALQFREEMRLDSTAFCLPAILLASGALAGLWGLLRIRRSLSRSPPAAGAG